MTFAAWRKNSPRYALFGWTLIIFERHDAIAIARFYDFLLKVCELVNLALLPREGGTGTRFYNILRDEVRMHALFEKFVLNFFKIERKELGASSKHLDWDAKGADLASEALIPTMITRYLPM